MSELDDLKVRLLELQKTIIRDKAHSNSSEPIDLKDYSLTDKTKLHFAVATRNIQMIELLVESGVELNSRISISQWTPLMLAASLGDTEIIKILLKAGADISLIEASGMDALKVAESYDQSEASSMLREAITQMELT